MITINTTKQALRAMFLAQRQTISALDQHYRQNQALPNIAKLLNSLGNLVNLEQTVTQSKEPVNQSVNRHINICVALYYAYAGEPDILNLINSLNLLNHNQLNLITWTWALPVVLAKDAPLQFARWQLGEPLIKGSYGINVPKDKVWVEPDIVLIPCVGYSEQGHRLGYGGGYYDRTLAKLSAKNPAVIAIGVAWHEARCVMPLPLDEFDVLMTQMVLL